MNDIDKLEALVKKISERVAKLESPREPPAPELKPEDLIGKLVHGSFSSVGFPDGKTIGVLKEVSTSNSTYPYLVGWHWCSNILPLTEAEALVLVWRPKPKTRYDWRKAPAWANHAVRNKNGAALWVESSIEYPFPQTYAGIWHNIGISVQMSEDCILDASGDWYSSLERRPQ